MEVEGKIVEIYETFPLQMILQVEDAKYFISLTQNTLIKKGETIVDFSEIKGREQILIRGESTGPLKLIAEELIIK